MREAKILDFGSGVGVTANHLAKNNEVIAIERNAEMVQERICENAYEQIVGDLQELKQQENYSFDMVICHNALEYSVNRQEIFKEFSRVLKPNGEVSLIKHNHNGRILQKIAFENNLEEAIALINRETTKAAYFGEIQYYDRKDIQQWISGTDLCIEKVLGIRTFYALHANNEIRFDPIWQEQMFELEMKVSEIEAYRNIAFFNHFLFKKDRKKDRA